MPIDQKTSDQFRVMLGFAIQNKLEEFATAIRELGAQGYDRLVILAVRIAGHVVIETAERYPNRADLERIAEIAAKSRTGLPIDQEEIFVYLSKVVFGPEKVVDLLEDQQKAAVLPVFSLANIMISFMPKGLDQWGWLDAIEASIDAVDNLNEAVLPSAVYLFGKSSRA